jgi:hypothetical protein
LIESGLNGWERTEKIGTHTATGLKIAESVVHLHAGATYLIPQLGSPLSMKYGGNELGDSFSEFAAWTSAMSAIASHAAAEIRHALAEKDLEVHERFIDQSIEIEEFHEGKFTGLSLYNNWHRS